MPQYRIYTDGACSGNPGRGGWAAILFDEQGGRRELHGRDPHTTNNRMELLAAIKGLEAVPPGSEVTVYSDSQYLVHTMTRGWRRQANLDLWQRLDALAAQRRVRWVWVRGHTGHPENEAANALATYEAGLGGSSPASDKAPTSSPTPTSPGPRAAAAPPSAADGAPSADRAAASEGGQPSPPAPLDKLGTSLGAAPPPGGEEGRDPTPFETRRLTHVDPRGHARMVEVGSKDDTLREAVARGFVYMSPETLRLVQEGRLEKGDVGAVARVAGIMAAKRTSDLVPLCHPLPLTGVQVEVEPDAAAGGVRVTATVRTVGKTGVEMEALTAVAVAALTVYDMCKAVQRDMRIGDVRLVRKTGGKSGDFVLQE